jgi:hypothetical protein
MHGFYNVSKPHMKDGFFFVSVMTCFTPLYVTLTPRVFRFSAATRYNPYFRKAEHVAAGFFENACRYAETQAQQGL